MERKISKVEVEGLEALFYDEIMQLISGFSYNRFIKKCIRDMHIQPNESVLDLGSGTGKNICIIGNYSNSLIVGLDKGTNMLKISKKRCRKYNNVKIFYHDIRKQTPFYEQFDIAFISFVLHGFIDNERDMIINNAFNALNNGGRFCILDYDEFDLDKENMLIKWVFNYGECPLAKDFIKKDLRKRLQNAGFKSFKQFDYYGHHVRLLIAQK